MRRWHTVVRCLSLLVIGGVLTATDAHGAEEEQGFFCLAGGVGASSCSYSINIGPYGTLDSCSITCEPPTWACCGLKFFTATACECRTGSIG